MSKLRKSELKAIVKECLIEILQEGAGQSFSSSSPEVVTESSRSSRTNRSAFDHVTWQRENSSQGEAEVENFSSHAAALSDDPILAEVLADSSRTLQMQMAAERKGVSAMSGDSAARTVASSELADLFGNASAKWATLAFE